MVLSAYSFHCGLPASEAVTALVRHAINRGIRQARKAPPGNALLQWSKGTEKAPQWATQAAADWLRQHGHGTARPEEAQAVDEVLTLCPVENTTES